MHRVNTEYRNLFVKDPTPVRWCSKLSSFQAVGVLVTRLLYLAVCWLEYFVIGVRVTSVVSYLRYMRSSALAFYETC